MFCPNTKDPPEGFVEDLKKVTTKKIKKQTKTYFMRQIISIPIEAI